MKRKLSFFLAIFLMCSFFVYPVFATTPNERSYSNYLRLSEESYPVLGSQLTMRWLEEDFYIYKDLYDEGYFIYSWDPFLEYKRVLDREGKLTHLNQEQGYSTGISIGDSHISIELDNLYAYSRNDFKEDAKSILMEEQRLALIGSQQKRQYNMSSIATTSADGLEIIYYSYTAKNEHIITQEFFDEIDTFHRGMIIKRPNGILLMIEVEGIYAGEFNADELNQVTDALFSSVKNGSNDMDLSRRTESILGNNIVIPESYTYSSINDMYSDVGGFYSYLYYFKKVGNIDNNAVRLYFNLNATNSTYALEEARKRPNATMKKDSVLGMNFEWITWREDRSDPNSGIRSLAYIYLEKERVYFTADIYANNMTELEEMRRIVRQIKTIPDLQFFN